MLERAAYWLALALAVAAVGAAAVLASDREERESSPSAAAQPPAGLPAPDSPLPREAGALARRLEMTSSGLRGAVARWRVEEGARGRTPEDVELLALDQQRVYLFAGSRPRLAGGMLARLRGETLGEARDVVAARRALVELSPKPERGDRRRRFRTGRPLPAAALLRFYKAAERRFRVDWEVLAAINFVETAFNRIRSQSTAGAQGPMQFIPATWSAYGMGGNIRDPRDAIMGAANYLRASGAPRDYDRALFAYNNSTLYVRAIRRYARRMRSQPHAYYAFHAWQLYVGTPDGLERLTGPGA